MHIEYPVYFLAFPKVVRKSLEEVTKINSVSNDKNPGLSLRAVSVPGDGKFEYERAAAA